MGKPWVVLARAAAIAAAGILTSPPADAGDIGPELTFGVAAGAWPAGAVAVLPYGYGGYVYGPLPYGSFHAPGGVYGSRIYDGPRIHRGSRIHSTRSVHHVTRARRVARVYHVFDPYGGGGPFYHRHYCCRYW